MDIHNAFPHSDLQNEVFMKFPLGFYSSRLGIVYKLQKSLYWLMQDQCCWFANLSLTLKDYGFVQILLRLLFIYTTR